MVNVAFWLQLALVVALLLAAVTSIIEAIHYDGLIDRAALIHPGNVDDVSAERGFNVTGMLATVIPVTILAVWLGLTLVWVRRGSHVARVLTLVGFGAPVVFFVLVCLAGGLFGFFGLFAVGLAGGIEEGPYPDEEFTDGFPGSEAGDKFYDTLYSLDTGGWSIAYQAILTTLAVVILLCAVATAALLLTGQANRFFRPERHLAQPHRFGFSHSPAPQYATPYPPQYQTPYPPQSQTPYPPQYQAPYPPQSQTPYPPQYPQSAAPYPAQQATPYPPQPAMNYPAYPAASSYPTPVPWGPPSVAYGPPPPPVAAFPPPAAPDSTPAATTDQSVVPGVAPTEGTAPTESAAPDQPPAN